MPKYTDPETEAHYQRNISLKRILKRRMAAGNMLDFIQLCRPDPEESEDPAFSAFEVTPLARLLAQILERVDRGQEKRVCVSVGPQFGKSDVLSRYGPAWLSGRDPRRHMILGSYNDTFAQEFGGDVREIMNNKEFKHIFPRHALRKGSEAKDLLITTDGGKMAFVGVGGSGTGKPADIFNVDDPFKSDEDAQSALYREKVWKWFNATVFSRCHKRSAVLVVHTRWHEDDLIGRLCDPDHPDRDKKYKGIADRWTYYNLPAIIQDPVLAHALGLTLEVPTDPFIRAQFGGNPMVSLWENRKSLDFLAEAKQMDSRTFGALYMGQPSPDDGSYFRDVDLVEEYDPISYPKNLKKYGASDHAVSQKQTADSTVLGCVGVDETGDIWVLPDIVWERMETDQTVDEIIGQMKTHKPELWWMESELISKSFGPFLKRRMYEESVFTTLDPKVPTKEKKTRARSIQGRMRQRRVHFPAFAPWWPEAKQQLLKFPYGTHDDFVDWLSWVGLGLTQEYSAPKTKSAKVITTGTLAWVKMSADAKKRREGNRKATQGW
jgi:predicted phage terminase large subunit-like protein